MMKINGERKETRTISKSNNEFRQKSRDIPFFYFSLHIFLYKDPINFLMSIHFLSTDVNAIVLIIQLDIVISTKFSSFPPSTQVQVQL